MENKNRFSGNLKLLTIQIGIVAVLLVIIEGVSCLSLPADSRTLGFFIKFPDGKNYSELQGFGFDQIDPLLGWAESREKLTKKGFDVAHNCMVLKSKLTNDRQPLRILITGGSTTDIALNKKNWPAHLSQIFEANGIKADIYVGATGGYNSGQELLKTLRDGVKTLPDIHISYSGANEIYDAYVSEYEENFFLNSFRNAYTTPLLPNTVYVLRRLFQLDREKVIPSLKANENEGSSEFWLKNMKAMHGLSRVFNYRFLGILQPVLVSNSPQHSLYYEDYKSYMDFSDKYEQYYPAIIDSIPAYPEFLYNLSGVFDTTRGKVYIDDCHLEPAYQPMIAQSVFDRLKEGEYLSH